MSIYLIKWDDQSLFYRVAYIISITYYGILSPKTKDQELHNHL